MSAEQVRTARLSLRLPAEVKARIERAAVLSGQNLTDFVVATLSERAADIEERERVWILSEEAFAEFARVLDDPPPPNQALVDLMRQNGA